MDIKDVENLAELAKIDLNENEKKQILKDMGGILEYVKVIESVEAPTIVGVPTGVRINVWREDLPASGGLIKPSIFSRDLIIKQFPDSQDGFLKVKKIL